MQKIQASRNMPDLILYGGDLQDNTDTYFKANNLASQDDVPEGPPKIFRNYGATAVIDEQPSLSIGLQVPRNPQQIALNEYFGRQRLRDFAVGQSRMNISEQIAKQAELMANNLVRDEIDRRAGIRRSVLEATGFTPAQIEQEIAANALAGINQTALDIRDKQVQDAVNLYYNVNNIPLPVTTTGGLTGAIAATVPTSVAGELPATDAEAAVATDMAGLDGQGMPEFIFGGAGGGGGAGDGEGMPEFIFGGAGGGGGAGAGDGEGEGAGVGIFGGGESDWGDGGFAGQGGASNAAAEIPEETRGIAVGDTAPLPDVSAVVRDMNVQALVDYIIDNNIIVPLTENTQTGRVKAPNTLKKIGREALVSIVTAHMSQATRMSIANKQGNGSGK
jgi:hypothetical protein